MHQTLETAIWKTNFLTLNESPMKSNVEPYTNSVQDSSEMIPIKFQFNHGISMAFYFQDPEGNLIEVYWCTGVEHPQGMVFLSPPCAQEIDLTKTEEELLAELKALTHRMGLSPSGITQLAAGVAK